MSASKSVTFFIFICLIINAAAAQVIKTGKWSGWIKQAETAYSYTLQISKVTGDSLFGTSTSRSKDFFCETKFIGVQQKGKWYLTETIVLRTNYKGAGSVCLMSMSLSRAGNRLQGTFTSSSNELKDCGSGTIALQFMPAPVSLPTKRDSGKAIITDTARRSPTPVPIVKDQKETIIVSPVKASPAVVVRSVEKRPIELIDTFVFDDDSIMIRIYDNGVIDGDIISLVINEQVVMDKVKLNLTPVEFTINSSSINHFQIEFFAENLGEIPPNTGLVVLSGRNKRNEVVFSSDLKKTNAFNVILRKKE